MGWNIMHEGRDNYGERGINPETKEQIKEIIYEVLDEIESGDMNKRMGYRNNNEGHRNYEDGYGERQGVKGTGPYGRSYRRYR